MRPALVPGGAVVFDDAGQVAFGLSDASLRSLIGEAPDFMRMAVPNLITLVAFVVYAGSIVFFFYQRQEVE